jgi:hypothetical protein
LKEKKEASTNKTRDKPSRDCKDFLVDLIARFYESKSSMALERKYIRYGEASPNNKWR